MLAKLQAEGMYQRIHLIGSLLQKEQKAIKEIRGMMEILETTEIILNIGTLLMDPEVHRLH